MTAAESEDILIPGDIKIRKAKDFVSGKPVKYTRAGESTVIHLGRIPTETDYVVELEIAD